LEWHVIIRQLNRVTVDAPAQLDRADGAALPSGRAAGRRGREDGGSGVAVMTAERVLGFPRAKGSEPLQLELSRRADGDGNQIVSLTGELDIATAEQAYAYISDVIDTWPAPVSVDLSGLTFCDASGLGVLARIARHARQAGRQLSLTAARPSLLKIMRITGLDRAFPELIPPAGAY
jgi:anti-sigma B factor antagonist